MCDSEFRHIACNRNYVAAKWTKLLDIYSCLQYMFNLIICDEFQEP